MGKNSTNINKTNNTCIIVDNSLLMFQIKTQKYFIFIFLSSFVIANKQNYINGLPRKR